MNTTVFAEEVAVDSVDEAVEATADAVEVAVDAYEPIDGGKHASDKIDKEEYAQVPDNWGINADPKTWSLATKIVSTDKIYYAGTYTEYRYYVYGTWSGEDNAHQPINNKYFDLYITKDEEEYPSYSEIEDEILATQPDGYAVNSINRTINYVGPSVVDTSKWTVYNPISYFFNPVSYHLVDGQLVVPKEAKNDAKKSGAENVIYRVLPAGTDTFVLVKVTADGADLGQNVEVIRATKADDDSKREVEKINDRYKGDEPIITFSGLKAVNIERDDDNNVIEKKGELPVFDVDAVLIKRENDKNTLVKGLSVKKVTFKYNVNASLPEEYVNEKHDSVKDGSGTIYRNGYEITKKNNVDESAKFVGTDYKAQLTKTENANFKGQPSFQVSFEVKGDAKAYSKDVKKAEKANKGADTTFNFEIAQLNIGDWKDDEATTTLTVTGSADTQGKADEAVAKTVKSYRDKYQAAYKELYAWATDATVKGWVDDEIKGQVTKYDPDKKSYTATITFTSVPMYVDKDVDAMMVSENGAQTDGNQLRVRKDDVKNLKFGKNGKVSAKLALLSTYQELFTPNGTETAGQTKVGKWDKPFAYVKTTSKAGGSADVILTSATVTDATFGEIPYAIAQGQNDLTGAMTMRIKTDAHGDDSIEYGHYKDANNFTVDSLED